MNRHRWIRASAIALGLALLPALASAHPLGNFTVNHYAGIRVAADHADLDVVIDYAEIPTVAESRRLDTDGDGQANPSELGAARAASCAKLSSLLELTLNGAYLRLITRAAGLELLPGVAGLHTLRLVCEYRAVFAAPATAGSVVAFADTSSPDRIGWREIVASGDGLRLSAANSAAGTMPNSAELASGGVSQRLTHYPTDLLTRPLDQRSLVAGLQPGGPTLPSFLAPDATPLDGSAGEGARSSASGVVPGGVAGDLWGLINLRDLTLPVILVSLLGAAVLGGGHALTPGHGKTVMAAYLVGSHGTVRQAMVLGISVTISHTLGVIGLALVVQLAADVIAPERIYPVLAAISGGMVVAIGAWLLYGCMRRWRDRAHERRPVGSHEHGHSHSHEHPHSHPHPGPRRPGMLGVIGLGVAGGLVPSTAALVLMLAALAGGHAAYGLALAVAFGIGMAVVLSGIGIALAHGRAMAVRLPVLPGARRLAAGLPWLTATAVFVGGLLLTSQALVLRL
jgi:nickel/cobalt transporter (NicO) family protein